MKDNFIMFLAFGLFSLVAFLVFELFFSPKEYKNEKVEEVRSIQLETSFNSKVLDYYIKEE